MAQMRASLANLLGLNQKLIASSGIVGTQKDKLAAELKKVKVMISRAGNLRCKFLSPDGENKTRVVNLCRQVIQDKNFYSLINIISKERA